MTIQSIEQFENKAATLAKSIPLDRVASANEAIRQIADKNENLSLQAVGNTLYIVIIEMVQDRASLEGGLHPRGKEHAYKYHDVRFRIIDKLAELV